MGQHSLFPRVIQDTSHGAVKARSVLNEDQYTQLASGTVISGPARSFWYTTNKRNVARKLRDEDIHKFPLLPQALYTFMQVASSRNWTVTGTPRRASRAVEKLNSVYYIDDMGVVHRGWQEFVQRMVLDWLILGHAVMLVPKVKIGSRTTYGAINYVDPLDLVYNEPREKYSRVVTNPNKIFTNKVYEYDDALWGFDEVFINTAIPLSRPFSILGPVFSLIPTMLLLHYVREHDMAAADGRKVRDIFLTYDDNMRDALVQGLEASVALWQGDNKSKHGIPIVSANIMGAIASQVEMSKLIHRIGLSDIPDGLDREALWLRAANEISGALGLPLRTWFEDPRGTNRSLERVSQERERVKGPAFFNRSIERMVNESGILGRVRFQFDEERDASIERIRSDIILTWAKAINYLYATFGGVIDLSVLWQLLQRNGLVYDDPFLQQQLVTLTEEMPSGALVDNAQVKPAVPEGSYAGPQEQELEARYGDDQQDQNNMDEEEIVKWFGGKALDEVVDMLRSKSAQMPKVELTRTRREELEELFKHLFVESSDPEYGEVVLDENGHILDVRRKVFHVGDVLEYTLEAEYESPQDFTITQEDGREIWKKALNKARMGGENAEVENE